MARAHRVRRKEIRHQVLAVFREHLARDPGTTLAAGELHPADMADVLWMDLPPEAARRIFLELPQETAAEVLAEAEDSLRERLVDGTDPIVLGRILGEMPADDGADVLEILSDEVRPTVLRQLEPDHAKDLRQLGAYEPESAGGMMTTEFLAARPDERVGDVIKRMKRDEGEAETIHNVYVVEGPGILTGVTSARELIEAGIHEDMSAVMNPDVILARVDEDQEEVVHRILHYNLSALPIVDQDGILLGIVTADDALEVLQEEASEDAFLLAGASSASEPSESLVRKVLHRAPMLLVTVLGGLAMARVLELWDLWGQPQEDTSLLSIVPYLPMVLAMVATVGQQTAALAVRGIAVGQIHAGRRLPFFLTEVQVGAALGLISCAISAPLVMVISGSPAVGLSLGASLVIAMTWTTTAASSIALGSHAIGLDPALVSGPMMTAVSDISAVMVFFSIANSFLNAA